MSRKLNFVPHIPNYEAIRKMMKEDLDYRLESRQNCTSLGRPLYERINVQIIMTHECPYHCPFCIERKHPMTGEQNFQAQLDSLAKVLLEHKNARVTITGGEPSLYPMHVAKLAEIYRLLGNGVFLAINTAGYNPLIARLGHINLSVNDYVHPDVKKFSGCTYQTVLTEGEMTTENLKRIMLENQDAGSFSFRFLCDLDQNHYDVSIWNALQDNPEFKIGTFRVGDFFVYCTFDWNGRHGRVTLGDMRQQMQNDYGDGYSNIIIHPDGSIGTNWR